ncbi:MAG: hypothetical protein Q7R40_12615 [Phaeospirillum sp.]|nr:hypothetical protein [Phaeospirillum sp.]
MSIFRKILIGLVCIVVAGVSSWLRYGDVEAAKQWLERRPPPSSPEAPSTPREEVLPVHLSYGGIGVTSHEGVMVLHFRRPDTMDETMAKVVVKVFDPDGHMKKDIGIWGVFRHDPTLGASIARFVVGTFPTGTYRVVADIGSRHPLGVRRAAIEFAIRDAEPVWSELARDK